MIDAITVFFMFLLLGMRCVNFGYPE
jgi:hypothetical protein